MLKAAKAQLYLRKVASACRVVKYNRAIGLMNKEAAGIQDWARSGMSALGSGMKSVAKGMRNMYNTASNAVTNTAQKISNTASNIGEQTKDFLGGVNHNLTGQTTPYYNSAALRQPARAQGAMPGGNPSWSSSAPASQAATPPVQQQVTPQVSQWTHPAQQQLPPAPNIYDDTLAQRAEAENYNYQLPYVAGKYSRMSDSLNNFSEDIAYTPDHSDPSDEAPDMSQFVGGADFEEVPSQDQSDMDRINDMAADEPSVSMNRPEMNPEPSQAIYNNSDYDDDEEPTPMMGQTAPYIPEISTPEITPPPVSKPTQRVPKKRKRTQNTQVAQSAPAPDTSYFDSLSPDLQVNWVAYSHATNRRGTYPTSQQDLADANRYRQTYGLRPGIKKYYTTAQKVVENRRRNQANRQANQQTSNQMVSNY